MTLASGMVPTPHSHTLISARRLLIVFSEVIILYNDSECDFVSSLYSKELGLYQPETKFDGIVYFYFFYP